MGRRPRWSKKLRSVTSSIVRRITASPGSPRRIVASGEPGRPFDSMETIPGAELSNCAAAAGLFEGGVLLPEHAERGGPGPPAVLVKDPWDGQLSGVFGALRHAAPDAWARLVIDRLSGRTDLTEIDYLLESPEDRAGALSFGRGVERPAPVRDFNRVVNLDEVREANLCPAGRRWPSFLESPRSRLTPLGRA
jgi:hypothetical protein